jgi:Domain of unknown function (DUF397)
MSSTDLSGALWRKSSDSNGQANCVEVAAVGDGQASVCVRDGKAPDTFGLAFTARAWRQFTDRVKPRGAQAGLHDDVRRELPAGRISELAAIRIAHTQLRYGPII